MRRLLRVRPSQARRGQRAWGADPCPACLRAVFGAGREAGYTAGLANQAM